MAWHFEQDKPIYIQIADKLRTDIVCGVYQADQRMPSVREIAFEAAVNPNTMQRAMADLEREGLIYAKGTSGRFVTSDRQHIENARTALLDSVARDFLAKCDKLGLDRQQAAKLIEDIK